MNPTATRCESPVSIYTGTRAACSMANAGARRARRRRRVGRSVDGDGAVGVRRDKRMRAEALTAHEIASCSSGSTIASCQARGAEFVKWNT
eukprot:2017552-Prymnesium_polylepis.1